MFDLEQILSDAGLTVERYSPPAGYRRSWASGGPVGQMVHHTAAPNPYPLDSLSGRREASWGGTPLVKCNIAPRQDGRLVVITSEACNYSSGIGSAVVIKEARDGVAPSGSAASRGLRDDAGGNSFFINWEVDHPGDGSQLPSAQWRALVLGLKAVSDALGMEYASTVGHAEFTKRKIDPRWNNADAHTNMKMIRAAMQAGSITPPTPLPPEQGVPVAKFMTLRLGSGFVPGTFDPNRNSGTALPKLHPEREAGRKLQSWLANDNGNYVATNTFNDRHQADGLVGNGTIASVKEFQRDAGLADDGVVGPKTWTALSPIEE